MAGGNANYSKPCVSFGNCPAYCFLVVLSSVSWNFILHMYRSWQRFTGTLLWVSRALSLCSFPYSNLSPRLSKTGCWALFGSALPEPPPVSRLQAVSLARALGKEWPPCLFAFWPESQPYPAFYPMSENSFVSYLVSGFLLFISGQ